MKELLDGLEDAAAGGSTDVPAALAYVAGVEIELDADELRGALRRAVLLLAAGGDPHRQLDPDGRAATALADDLGTPGRLAALADGLAALEAAAAGHPLVAAGAARLAAAPDAAWRWYATALLAEHLSD